MKKDEKICDSHDCKNLVTRTTISRVMFCDDCRAKTEEFVKTWKRHVVIKGEGFDEGW